MLVKTAVQIGVLQYEHPPILLQWPDIPPEGRWTHRVKDHLCDSQVSVEHLGHQMAGKTGAELSGDQDVIFKYKLTLIIIQFPY